jgi:hypothetical protein
LHIFALKLRKYARSMIFFFLFLVVNFSYFRVGNVMCRPYCESHLKPDKCGIRAVDITQIGHPETQIGRPETQVGRPETQIGHPITQIGHPIT